MILYSNLISIYLNNLISDSSFIYLNNSYIQLNLINYKLNLKLKLK